MEWQDEGVVLARKPLGERDALVSLLTFEHGRHAGVVKGGMGKRRGPMLQQGNRLAVTWKARLEQHLGQLDFEAVRLYPAGLLERPLELAALASAASLLEHSLPERDPHPKLYAALVSLLESFADELAWPERYVRFEVLLLQELGFGLDLATCAVTGSGEGLAYVSPKTGRAVSEAGAGEWKPRLLPLPLFLTAGTADGAAGESRSPKPNEIAQGLRLAGWFLDRHIFEPAERLTPASRERLVGLWRAKHPDALDVTIESTVEDTA